MNWEKKSTKKDKLIKVYHAARRQYRSMIQSVGWFKLEQHEFLGKYETLSRNWIANKLEIKMLRILKVNKIDISQKRRSKSIIIIDSNPINQLLIIPIIGRY